MGEKNKKKTYTYTRIYPHKRLTYKRKITKRNSIKVYAHTNLSGFSGFTQ